MFAMPEQLCVAEIYNLLITHGVAVVAAHAILVLPRLLAQYAVFGAGKPSTDVHIDIYTAQTT